MFNIDLAPTILDFAGISKPEYMQGESMLDLIRGKNMKNGENQYCSNIMLMMHGRTLVQIN